MVNKKEKAIIFITNKDYLFALSTVLVNLQMVSPNSYDDVIVYSDGLSNTEQDNLRKIEENIKFINYSLNDWIKEHKEVTTQQAQTFLKKYSHLAWAKYKIFEQLEFYEKVLFLDLDILIKQDITDLFNITTQIAWRSGQNFHGKFGNKKNLITKISSVPINYPSPNGGLLYATDTFNYRKFCKDARDFTIQFLDYFSSGLDELAIAWSASQNSILIHELDEFEYNTLPAQYYSTTKILHFMGEEKLWNNELLQTIFPKWITYHNKVLELTNFDSQKVKKYENFGQTIRKQLNEIRWFNLLKNKELIIPENFRLDYNFSNEWLILNYVKNSKIYYEFKFNQFQSGYSVGLWIKDKFYLNDKDILTFTDDLVKKNNYINKIVDTRGIYLYTNKVDIDEISILFQYFIRITKPIVFP